MSNRLQGRTLSERSTPDEKHRLIGSHRQTTISMSSSSSSNDSNRCCSRPKCSDFGLGGVAPTTFVQTQCRMPYAVYLIYRLVVTSYLLGYFLYNLIVSVRPGGYYGPIYMIYLTNWGYILMLIYLLCALWNLIVYGAFMKPSGWTQNDDVPWYFFHRGQWALFNTYASAAILISILYWGATYVPGSYSLYYDINFHALNAVFAIVEILFTATVVRVLHFIYPLAFACVYVSFSGIYWAAGGTDEEGERYIYPILDYGMEPAMASGLAVGACVAAVIIHTVVVWGLHKLKVLMLSSSCCPVSCRPEYTAEEDGATAERGGAKYAEGTIEMKV